MALMKCTECGHEVSDKASICPNCGCPIEKGLVCDECGASISETDEMCSNCGNPINSKKGFNWKKSILSIVVLLFVLGGTYGIWQLMGSIDERRGDIEITAKLSEAVHRYDEVSNFHEGLSAVCKNNKWGYINSKGDEVIPCKYESACDFSEGLACVYLTRDDNMPIAFIDNNGNTVISGYYGGSRFGRLKFKNGKCLVMDKDKNEFYIDKEGNRTDEPNNIENGSDEMPDVEIFYDNDKMGVKDTLGNIIVQAKYSYIDDFSEGLAVAYLYCSGDKNIYGFVDKKGNSTFTESDFAQLAKYEMEQEAERALEEAKERERKVIVGTYIFNPRKDNYASVDMYNGQKWWKDRKLVGYIEWTEYLVVMEDYRVSLLSPSRREFVGTVSDYANGAFVISINSPENARVGAWTTLYRNGKDIGRLGDKGYGFPDNVVIDTKTKRIYKRVDDYKNKDVSDVEYIMYDSFSSVIEQSNNTEVRRSYLNDEYEREYGN